ncbi:DUF7167 family protein [Paenibacillus sp. CAU 1782]
MIIRWKLSIGYPSACREGEVEIDDKDLEGLDEEKRQEAIFEAIWEDAMQYVDVYTTGEEESQ